MYWRSTFCIGGPLFVLEVHCLYSKCTVCIQDTLFISTYCDDSLFSSGNFEEAVELFTAAIKLNPHSAPLFAKRARCVHVHHHSSPITPVISVSCDEVTLPDPLPEFPHRSFPPCIITSCIHHYLFMYVHTYVRTSFICVSLL